MTRRGFLLGLLGLCGLGFKTADGGNERFNPAYFDVVTRTVMDTERLLFKVALGRDVTLKGQVELYALAARAIEEHGLDAMRYEFWHDLLPYLETEGQLTQAGAKA